WLTYEELNERANQLAHQLQKQGVGPETLVGLSVERAVTMHIAVLAIIKAGGAYVPLDPSYPAERLAFMLADTGLQLVLTQEHLREMLPAAEGVRFLCLDTPESIALLAREPSSNPANGVGGNHLAYLVYTSGSTGRPKGVLIEQQSVIRLVHQPNYVHLGANEISLHLAPLSFDAAT